MMKLLANCLDARYIEDVEVLLVFLEIPDMGYKRVLPINRCDCRFGELPVVPHEEMQKTAEMWKGKPFYLGIVDDDGEYDPKDSFLREKVMLGDIGTQMLDIAEKMSTDEWIMRFKQEEMFKRVTKKCGV
jgi:hypothetical protein